MRFCKQQKKKCPSEGFTIIESIVAIGILITAVGGPLTLATQSVATSRELQQQVTAVYLAQEALEYIRNKRDDNVLQNTAWLDGIDVCFNTHCYVDIPVNMVDTCVQCEPIQYNNTTGFYGGYTQSGSDWEDTLYTRIVILTEIGDDDNEVRVESIVTWPVGTRTRTVAAEDILFDWQTR